MRHDADGDDGAAAWIEQIRLHAGYTDAENKNVDSVKQHGRRVALRRNVTCQRQHAAKIIAAPKALASENRQTLV